MTGLAQGRAGVGAPSKLKLTFGDLLRQYRRAARLTQEQLAERTGMSARGISDLERGARQAPHRDTLRLLAEALGLSAEEAVALEAAVVRLRRGTVPSAGSPPAGRSAKTLTLPALPAPLTSFVGREAEVAAAVHLLRRGDVRLLTLLGPPGVGKTRLALRTGAVADADFADGVLFVALAPLTDPALVLPTIAYTYGIADTGGRSPLEGLVGALRERRMLLLLDNFEHIAAAAPDVVAMLQACPGLVALVTSRAALAVQGEHQLPVPPLAVPEPEDLRKGNAGVVAGTMAQYPAVRLLIERAQAVKPDFAPTPENLPLLAEICRRLDGLPLAIELAAPRLKVVSPHTLLTRLEHLLPTLTGSARDLPERQHTMRATIAWSEGLLTESQRAMFRRLAVFSGGWTLDAAEAICRAPPGAASLELDALEGLSALVDRSLVQQHEEVGEPRFSMLHVIREYALEELAASGEAGPLRRAHATFHTILAEREQAIVHQQAENPKPSFERLTLEQDNLRAAIAWACEQGDAVIGLRLAAALGQIWTVLGRGAESGKWAQMVLALPVDQRLARDAEHRRLLAQSRMMVAYFAAQVSVSQYNLDRATALLEESAAIAREIGSPTWVAGGLIGLAEIALRAGDAGRAHALAEEALAGARESGNVRALLEALMDAEQVIFNAGDDDRTVVLAEELLELAAETHIGWYQAKAKMQLAQVACYRGELDRAYAVAIEGIEFIMGTGNFAVSPDCLLVLAAVASQTGLMARAARLLGALDYSMTLAGLKALPREETMIDTATKTARATLGVEAWNAVYKAGHALSLEEVVAEALGEEITPANSADRPERPVLPATSKSVQTRP